jgi:UPF0755 protein
MRRLGLIAAAAVAGLVVAAGLATRSYLAMPLDLPAGGYVLEVRAGDSLTAVARRLADAGVLRRPVALAAWGRWSGQAARIRAGEYALRPGLTPPGLLDQLVAGDVILHTLTLVEGRTVRDVLAILRATPALATTLAATTPSELAAELGLGVDSAEGRFFPDTYRFARGTTDRAILLRAHAAMEQALAAAWASRLPDSPLTTPDELLVLASIVERETALGTERPRIAGVFARRLALGMRLQADPTVIYGLGPAFDGNLRRADLERDTPFNTYTRTGLPPTPIALPGAAALAAAAQPAPGDALYFVATGRGDGSHRFSSTLAEHNRAVQAFLTATRD